jgi:N-acetylglucosaminyldiphosphoundecaprenol N-acetyl-beta-D-mannosaminyltransferase
MSEARDDGDLLRTEARELDPASRFDRDIVCVLGLPFDTVDLSQAVEKIRAAAFSNARCFVSTPNLNFLIAAQRDPGFRDSVLRSDLSLADGAPIVWIARCLRLPLTARVAGASVFEALRAQEGPPLTVDVFGGPPGVAEAACRNLNAVAGGLRCVGFDDAGFGSLDEMSAPERIKKINATGAQFVVVALGAKRGQGWIERNAAALEAPVLCHLGAVVNFVAGTVKRAPVVLQRFGLEWLWRIKEERGLWRRYFGDGVAVSRLVFDRVLPYAFFLRRRKGVGQSPGLRVSRAGENDIAIRLGGAWIRATLEPLRHALRQAAIPGIRVSLMLREVTDVDGAFIALLMLARGRLGAAHLRILEAPPVVRSIFCYNAAEFLLEPAHIE